MGPPVRIRTRHTEFFETHGNEKPHGRNMYKKICGAQKSVEKFMKWLVEDKWNLPDSHLMRTLYTEFVAVFGNKEAHPRNMYIFLWMKTLIETCGILVLDPDGHRINFFKSSDGKVWSGVHRKWHGKSKKLENDEDEMAPVEEEDEAQRTEQALGNF